MSEQRFEYARKKCLRELPINERVLYQYVESRELILADEAVTENHLLHLIQENSPIFEAAEAFNLDPKTVYDTVQRIEAHLVDCAPAYAEKFKFVDHTDLYRLHGLCPVEKQVKYFLFTDE
ncbi:helix-turn-helix domain-containing protein [Salipaludibacillus sp. HK11]|uniref:helix-turn-helix domain-containing protein n=1 Tax=Salipaludibacillus sp. HK11 TaxID=3394320 RepID=UPI0039FB9CF8